MRHGARILADFDVEICPSGAFLTIEPLREEAGDASSFFQLPVLLPPDLLSVEQLFGGLCTASTWFGDARV